MADTEDLPSSTGVTYVTHREGVGAVALKPVADSTSLVSS